MRQHHHHHRGRALALLPWSSSRLVNGHHGRCRRDRLARLQSAEEFLILTVEVVHCVRRLGHDCRRHWRSATAGSSPRIPSSDPLNSQRVGPVAARVTLGAVVFATAGSIHTPQRRHAPRAVLSDVCRLQRRRWHRRRRWRRLLLRIVGFIARRE